MKFTSAFEKKNADNIGTVEGHNARLHATKSQLPKEAWFTETGHQTIVGWRQDRLDDAKKLAKRKDAVLAVEFIFQVGNQTDWRDMPTKYNKYGKVKREGLEEKLQALARGAKEAIMQEFGEHNVVSLVLHTDESTPHIHAVVTPIFEGKLQAKKWLNGKSSCAEIRKRLHSVVNKHIACDYTAGAPGGLPHSEAKRAGNIQDEASKLRDELDAKDRELQRTFSRLKSAEKRLEDEKKEREIMAGTLKSTQEELDSLKMINRMRQKAAQAAQAAKEEEGTSKMMKPPPIRP